MDTKMIEVKNSDSRIEGIIAVKRGNMGWYFIIRLKENDKTFAITRNYCGWEPVFSSLNLSHVPPSDFYLDKQREVIRKGSIMRYYEIKQKLKKLLTNDNIQLARQEN